MRYMCANCRSIFTAAWAKVFPKLCPACQPKTEPPAGSNPATKRKRKRSEKTPPSGPTVHTHDSGPDTP